MKAKWGKFSCLFFLKLGNGQGLSKIDASKAIALKKFELTSVVQIQMEDMMDTTGPQNEISVAQDVSMLT